MELDVFGKKYNVDSLIKLTKTCPSVTVSKDEINLDFDGIAVVPANPTAVLVYRYEGKLLILTNLNEAAKQINNSGKVQAHLVSKPVLKKYYIPTARELAEAEEAEKVVNNFKPKFQKRTFKPQYA